MSTSKVTTNHNEIREWVEGRGGSPARVIGTDNSGGLGILRIDFPGYSGEGSLEKVDWKDWFQTFEDRELAFLYQEDTADGHDSHFNKLVWRREHAHNK